MSYVERNSRGARWFHAAIYITVLLLQGFIADLHGKFCPALGADSPYKPADHRIH